MTGTPLTEIVRLGEPGTLVGDLSDAEGDVAGVGSLDRRCRISDAGCRDLPDRSRSATRAGGCSRGVAEYSAGVSRIRFRFAGFECHRRLENFCRQMRLSGFPIAAVSETLQSVASIGQFGRVGARQRKIGVPQMDPETPPARRMKAPPFARCRYHDREWAESNPNRGCTEKWVRLRREFRRCRPCLPRRYARADCPDAGAVESKRRPRRFRRALT